MTDREMMEMAARAAGYVVESHHISGGAWVRPVGEMPDADGDYPGLFLWRPREDDGDALRLAVKLEILVLAARGFAVANSTDSGEGGTVVRIALKDDPCAATRRAIVRAAAEIGRRMK